MPTFEDIEAELEMAKMMPQACVVCSQQLVTTEVDILEHPIRHIDAALEMIHNLSSHVSGQLDKLEAKFVEYDNTYTEELEKLNHRLKSLELKQIVDPEGDRHNATGRFSAYRESKTNKPEEPKE